MLSLVILERQYCSQYSVPSTGVSETIVPTTWMSSFDVLSSSSLVLYASAPVLASCYGEALAFAIEATLLNNEIIFGRLTTSAVALIVEVQGNDVVKPVCGLMHESRRHWVG